jgi:hypothetical protein
MQRLRLLGFKQTICFRRYVSTYRVLKNIALPLFQHEVKRVIFQQKVHNQRARIRQNPSPQLDCDSNSVLGAGCAVHIIYVEGASI